VGKSFIALALAQKASRDGYSALYLRAAALLRELALARADGSLRHLLARLGRVDVLVIYDWATAPLNENERRKATVLPNPTRVYHKSPYPQCSAPTVLLSANLYARSTVDTALWISHQPSQDWRETGVRFAADSARDRRDDLKSPSDCSRRIGIRAGDGG
jgi:hypothetical protein